MTITATIAGAISMLANFAFFFGGSRDNNNPLGFVGVLVAAIVAPLAALLVQMAVSRTREYSADRAGAEITGRPQWLISALGKDLRAAPRRSATRTPSATRRWRISSSSTRSPARAWTTSSPPIPRPRTASPRCAPWTGERRHAPAGRASACRASDAPDPPHQPRSLGLKASRQRPERTPAQARPGFAVRAAATALARRRPRRPPPARRAARSGRGPSAYRALPDRDRRLAHAIVATALRRHGEITAALDRLIAKRPPRAGALHARPRDRRRPRSSSWRSPTTPPSRWRSTRSPPIRRRGISRASPTPCSAASRASATRCSPAPTPRASTRPTGCGSAGARTYGEATARAIAEAHLVEPCLDLSVRSEPELWAEQLGGIVLPTGSVRLVPAGPIEALPGFAEGAWWVQDAAAALPARLLGDVAGKRVADLCAAPGGKTAALAAARRAGDRGRHFGRSGSSGSRPISRGFSSRRRRSPPTSSTGARRSSSTPSSSTRPCSATGTIRRHPDIPWLKEPKDVAALAALQARMIDRAVDLLAAGRHARLLHLLARARGRRGAARRRARPPPARSRPGCRRTRSAALPRR